MGSCAISDSFAVCGVASGFDADAVKAAEGGDEGCRPIVLIWADCVVMIVTYISDFERYPLNRLIRSTLL
jgi:hypothetical protein